MDASIVPYMATSVGQGNPTSYNSSTTQSSSRPPLSDTSSTSKTSTELGGITLPNPREPVAGSQRQGVAICT